MKFVKILKELFKGNKITNDLYLEGDHYKLLDGRLVFGGPGWDDYAVAEFQEEDLRDKSWRKLK